MLDSHEAGPYFSHALAMQVAVARALENRARTGPVRVSVLDARGEVCAERCLCAQFKPAA